MKNKLGHSMGTIIQKEVERQNAIYRKEWGKAATSLVTTAALVVLHDTFGFGPKRLNRFQEHFESQMECINGGYVTIDDIKELAAELNKTIKVIDKEQEYE